MVPSVNLTWATKQKPVCASFVFPEASKSNGAIVCNMRASLQRKTHGKGRKQLTTDELLSINAHNPDHSQNGSEYAQ